VGVEAIRLCQSRAFESAHMVRGLARDGCMVCGLSCVVLGVTPNCWGLSRSMRWHGRRSTHGKHMHYNQLPCQPASLAGRFQCGHVCCRLRTVGPIWHGTWLCGVCTRWEQGVKLSRTGSNRRSCGSNSSCASDASACSIKLNSTS
jgi:hypothetical protein